MQALNSSACISSMQALYSVLDIHTNLYFIFAHRTCERFLYKN